ncbi:MAG: cytochrome, partial [Burkholderiaceae bacterium]|nr:cytochrome [Burkholderiaceae bacterium]
MSQTPRVHSGPMQDPHSVPIDQLDVSDPRLFENDAWRPFFARLRREDPVHYLADSPFGPFWSVTRFDDIVHVDTHHQVYSSEPFIVIGELVDELKIDSFIFMDPPKHD